MTIESSDRDLATRLREVRREIFGEHGAPLVAEALKVPVRTWLNYEAGVSVPGTTILAFLELTGVEPCWLGTGSGNKYRAEAPGSGRDPQQARPGLDLRRSASPAGLPADGRKD